MLSMQVTVSSLQEGSTYYYKVGDPTKPNGVSPVFSFKVFLAPLLAQPRLPASNTGSMPLIVSSAGLTPVERHGHASACVIAQFCEHAKPASTSIEKVRGQETS